MGRTGIGTGWFCVRDSDIRAAAALVTLAEGPAVHNIFTAPFRLTRNLQVLIYFISRALIVAIKPLVILLLVRFAANGQETASDLAFSFSVAAVTTTLFSLCAYKWRFHLVMGPRENNELTKRRAHYVYLNSIYLSAAVLVVVGAVLGFIVKPNYLFATGFAAILLAELLNSEDTRDLLYAGEVRRWAVNLLFRQVGYLAAAVVTIASGWQNLATIGLISLISAAAISAKENGRVRDLLWRLSPAGRLNAPGPKRPCRRIVRFAVDILGAASTTLTINSDKMLYYYFAPATMWQYAVLSYLGSIIPLGFDTFRMARNRSRYLERGSFYRSSRGIPVALADLAYLIGFALIAYAGFWGMALLRIVPTSMHWLYLSLIGSNVLLCVFLLASEKLFWKAQVGGLYGRIELAGTAVLALAGALTFGFGLGPNFVTIPMLLALQLKLYLAWRHIK